MARYFIDYENVGKTGLNGINNLIENDTVLLFLGNLKNEIPIETVSVLLHSKAQIVIKKMQKTAKNYLDFQLATCLGSFIASNEDKEFYIISNDTDFDAVIDYWRCNKKSVSIERRNTISSSSSEDIVKTVNATVKLDNSTKKTIRSLVKDVKLSPVHYTGIYNLFITEDNKQSLHTGLVRIFDQKQGSQLYNLLKDVFDQYKAIV